MQKIWPLLEFHKDWRHGVASGTDQTEAFKRTPSFELGNRIPEQERQSAGAGAMRTPPSGGQFSGVSIPGTLSFRKRERSLLGSRLRRKDARFTSFGRWRGWDFGFSSHRQWGSKLLGVPLAAVIGLAFGGRGRGYRSRHQPVCLQRWRA